METDFIEEFNDLFNFEENAYFYHITDDSKAQSILENGLLMVNKDLISTTIRITNAMINNPINFIKDEWGVSLREKTSMIIIGCPVESINYMVENNCYYLDQWIEEDKANYIIPNRFIIGSINMLDLKINYNENYQFGDNLRI